MIKWYEDPIYIKMCLKAEEIQEVWNPNHGDWCFCKDIKDLPTGIPYELRKPTQIIVDFDSEGEWFHLESSFIDKNIYTWLPNQAQLQEMIPLTLNWELNGFTNWNGQKQDYELMASKGDDTYVVKAPTMGQLWLAFAMKELYNKVWHNDEWVIV